ncbi:hypothetical protein HK096_008784 [Nowakowskiella sp. JEL0078]|nr:hypothetical protein HK096_008784 [Nowakowskiella sp. JEL0078]
MTPTNIALIFAPVIFGVQTDAIVELPITAPQANLKEPFFKFGNNKELPADKGPSISHFQSWKDDAVIETLMDHREIIFKEENRNSRNTLTPAEILQRNPPPPLYEHIYQSQYQPERQIEKPSLEQNDSDSNLNLVSQQSLPNLPSGPQSPALAPNYPQGAFLVNPIGPVIIAPLHSNFPPRDASLPEYDRSLQNSSSTSTIGTETYVSGMHQRQKSNYTQPFVSPLQGVVNALQQPQQGLTSVVIQQTSQQGLLQQGLNQQSQVITHTSQLPQQLVQLVPQVTQNQTQNLITPVRLELPVSPQRLERSVSLDENSS